MLLISCKSLSSYIPRSVKTVPECGYLGREQSDFIGCFASEGRKSRPAFRAKQKPLVAQGHSQELPENMVEKTRRRR